MLRASSESRGKTVVVKGVLSPKEIATGVEHQDVLVAFAEASVLQEQRNLAVARDTIAKQLGHAALVDAAAIVGNFERMNRIADACGISLGMLDVMTEGLQDELEIDHFISSANTRPVSGLKRLLMKLMMPLMMQRMARAVAKREAANS